MEMVLWYVGSEVKGALREVVEDGRWNVWLGGGRKGGSGLRGDGGYKRRLFDF